VKSRVPLLEVKILLPIVFNLNEDTTKSQKGIWPIYGSNFLPINSKTCTYKMKTKYQKYYVRTIKQMCIELGQLIMFLVITILLYNVSLSTTCHAGELNELETWEEWEKIFSNTNPWEFLNNKNGIRVYARPVQISPIKSFRGIMELEKTNINQIITLFKDVKSYPSFMSMCAHMEEQNGSTENKKYLFGKFKRVWPIKPRDCSVFTQWFYPQDSAAVVLRLKNKPNRIKLNPGYIRVPILMGYYKFTAKSDGKVEIIYEGLIDAGGWIPKWFINYYLENIPYKTLLNIRNTLNNK
jgi:hypothetical protein